MFAVLALAPKAIPLDGWIGSLPVFDTREAAERFAAGRYQIIELSPAAAPNR